MAHVCAHPTPLHLVLSTAAKVHRLMALGNINVVAELLRSLDEHWHHNELSLHAQPRRHYKKNDT
jgi:hypothetical protein